MSGELIEKYAAAILPVALREPCVAISCEMIHGAIMRSICILTRPMALAIREIVSIVLLAFAPERHASTSLPFRLMRLFAVSV